MTGFNVVAAEFRHFSQLRQQLLQDDPNLDEQTLADTLEGATNLREALSAFIRSALEDEALAKGLRTMLEAMKSRVARLEKRAESKRSAALNIMQRAEIKKLTEPDFTASLRSAPRAVIILQEAQIPEAFLIPQPPKIDRRAVLDALIQGKRVRGATLSNGHQTLSIRTE
jgi:hypothetical protein